jgi:hypothetical protein
MACGVRLRWGSARLAFSLWYKKAWHDQREMRHGQEIMEKMTTDE